MKLFTNSLDDEEIERIEGDHPEGVTAPEVVQIFAGKGVRFSEATFRKYVQLGLLPRSRRVRRLGRRGGSQGLYPSGVIRRIIDIKNLLADDYTMEEIRDKFLCATSEIDELEESISRVFSRLERTIVDLEGTGEKVSVLRREIKSAKADAESVTASLREIEGRLESRARRQTRQIRVV